MISVYIPKQPEDAGFFNDELPAFIGERSSITQRSKNDGYIPITPEDVNTLSISIKYCVNIT